MGVDPPHRGGNVGTRYRFREAGIPGDWRRRPGGGRRSGAGPQATDGSAHVPA